MIEITGNEIRIGVERDPLTDSLVKIDKDLATRAVITTDLTTLFVALIHRYKINTTAEIIEHALKFAQEVEKDVEADIRECDN